MKKLFASLFVLFLLVTGAVIFAMGNRSFSENENRVLKTRSEISSDVFGGEFQKDIETFMSDQFPLRDFCTAVQSRIKVMLGRRDINGAYIADDGRLFQKIMPYEVDEKSVSRHASSYDALSAEGLKVTLMPVPSAGTVFGDKLPKNAEMYSVEDVLEIIKENAPDSEVIDLRETLSNTGVGAYYRTDHHWTAYGAYEAYRAWCASNGETPFGFEELNHKPVTADFKGTLYSKVLDSRIEPEEIVAPYVPSSVRVKADGADIDFYNQSALETKDKYNYFLSGNHGIVEIDNPDGGDRVMIVVKDSFANSLVGYLINHCRKIIMIDERYAFLNIADAAAEYGATDILAVKEVAFF